MEHRRFRFVQQFRDRAGRQYAYFRRGGRRIPLPGTIGSPEFILAYTAASGFKSVPPPPPDPRFTGVYLLMLRGRLDYIGSSMNMPQRVNEHRSNGRPFDEVFYITTTADQRMRLERALIRAFKPRQNKR